MSDLEEEIMWAYAGTGEAFQCVDASFAREQQAEIERLRAALAAQQEGEQEEIRTLRMDNARLRDELFMIRRAVDRDSDLEDLAGLEQEQNK